MNQQPSGQRLHGSWLVVARGLWLAIVGLTLFTFVVGLQPAYDHLSAPCRLDCQEGWLTPEGLRDLEALGLSPGGYAIGSIMLVSIYLGTAIPIAFLIFWRRSDEPIALLVSLSFITFLFVMEYVEGLTDQSYLGAVWTWVMTTLAWTLFLLIFFLFPNGRFVPRWGRWAIVTWILLHLAALIVPRDSSYHPGNWSDGILALVFAAIMLSALFAPVYRYRRTSDYVQRQQIKWIIFSFVLILSIIIAAELPIALIPNPNGGGTIVEIVTSIIEMIASLLIPIMLAVSILRYRLWDIDMVINRALVYGVLTALLFAIYFASVLLLQQIFRTLAGHSSDLAIILSTLATAALFNPLRERIQHAIDRRFYRRKYDAEKTLATFAARLRNEVDLDRLTADLMIVVSETMQPANISLWMLRKPQPVDKENE